MLFFIITRDKEFKIIKSVFSSFVNVRPTSPLSKKIKQQGPRLSRNLRTDK